MALYNGIRGDSFKEMIKTMLTYAKVPKKYRTILLDDHSLPYFSTSFTDPSYDPDNNNYVLSALGNPSISKSIVWYFGIKYQLAKGIISRLKNRFENQDVLGKNAEEIFGVNLWDHISIQSSYREDPSQKSKFIEKALAAMFASIEIVLDKTLDIGVGNYVCNLLIVSLLEKIPSEFAYEDLNDSVSIVNDMTNKIKNRFGGKVDYSYKEFDDNGTKYYEATAYVGSIVLGVGRSTNKSEAKQMSATNARKTLETKYGIK